MNTQFKSAYTQEESSLPDLGQSSTPLMPDISISFKGVHKLLSELKIHKPAEPDSISPRLLREVADMVHDITVDNVSKHFAADCCERNGSVI
jgi:hypothetical protein